MFKWKSNQSVLFKKGISETICNKSSKNENSQDIIDKWHNRNTFTPVTKSKLI